MRFGLQVNPYFPGSTGNPWDSVARVARVADESAFDSLWLYDHFLYEGGYSGHPLHEPVMECFTTLGAIAAITQRVRLGQLVLGVPYRNPAMTAKMATTLDLISHGRSILGLGAGWHQREHEAYGWGAFEEAPVRLKRLEEAVRAMLALWTERPARFEGHFYRLDNVRDNPAPVQQPHPPIMIGGSGERVTLRLLPSTPSSAMSLAIPSGWSPSSPPCASTATASGAPTTRSRGRSIRPSSSAETTPRWPRSGSG